MLAVYIISAWVCFINALRFFEKARKCLEQIGKSIFWTFAGLISFVAIFC